MDPTAMVIIAAVIVGAIGGLVLLAVAGDQNPSSSSKSTTRSERYDRIFATVETKGVKPHKVSVIAASRGGGKSYAAAYGLGYQKGYQEGVDHAINELCEVDGEST